MFGLDDGGKMDNSLVESAVAIAQASSGALALIKKIPLFRDWGSLQKWVADIDY